MKTTPETRDSRAKANPENPDPARKEDGGGDGDGDGDGGGDGDGDREKREKSAVTAVEQVLAEMCADVEEGRRVLECSQRMR